MGAEELIQDLSVILIIVGCVSALFTRLGWPKVIGYIVAGMLIGKYTFGGSFIACENTIEVLGQLGVIFLMFSLGLEFNVGKLKKVGRVAAPTALLDMVVMVWLGHFVGTRILGWGSVESLFLGAAISDSATTLLAKTINDMGWGMRRFTRYIFGITIMEDIFCIGLIALLTGLAQSGSFDLIGFAKSMGGLGLFLFSILVFGILLIPRLINRVSRWKDEDVLLLTILGICFLISRVSDMLNFSLALGAFISGVLVADSRPLKRIERQCAPLRALFSAIFFVTIGMMVDPMSLLKLWPHVLGLTALVVVGKTVNCTVGALLTGQDLKNALQTGIGLAQIGEFAYMVALIGVSMKAVRPELYQVAIGVSLLTTILNPFLLRGSDPFANWLVQKVPESWKKNLATYGNLLQRFRHLPTPPEQIRKLHFHFVMVGMNLVLVAALFLAAGFLAKLDYTVIADWVETHKQTLLWAAASILMVPFGVLLFLHARKIGHFLADVFIPVKVQETLWAEAFRSFLIFLSVSFVMVILAIESFMLSGSIMPESDVGRCVMGGFLLLIAIFGVKRVKKMGRRSVETLRTALANESDVPESESAAELLDIHTERFVLPVGARMAGKSLRDLHLRHITGASVIGIDRNGTSMVNPKAEELLLERDGILLLGDDQQIHSAIKFLSTMSQ